MNQSNPAAHYLVEVYCDDGRKESYFFRYLSDVHVSIGITWRVAIEAGKIRKTIDSLGRGTVEMIAPNGTDWHTVLRCRPMAEVDTLHGPTHF